ncbi:hypothetical protein Anapl_09538 [Anas platyrhynchos]|uniref:Uncharacterized protein n=1 Tax=Anas platyrhynchos TaxID=8839 RepID=R0JAM7_ANAPL|nr:hypothetical protein Anapl_09538 [Anas platyrhynchos]
MKIFGLVNNPSVSSKKAAAVTERPGVEESWHLVAGFPAQPMTDSASQPGHPATCMPSASSPQWAACATFSESFAASPGLGTTACKREVTLRAAVWGQLGRCTQAMPAVLQSTLPALLAQAVQKCTRQKCACEAPDKSLAVSQTFTPIFKRKGKAVRFTDAVGEQKASGYRWQLQWRPQPTQATSAKSKQVSGAGSLPPQGLVLRRGTDTGSSCQLSRAPLHVPQDIAAVSSLGDWQRQHGDSPGLALLALNPAIELMICCMPTLEAEQKVQALRVPCFPQCKAENIS